ncbi:MAG: ribonuclease J [Lachnospiraceae bacterium]|nr:ribonuclease J [Lachnospiraceae bacterium]
MKKRKFNIGPKLKIIPLGGLEQIGMNMTAFSYEDSIFVVDCGLAFPTEDMFGIDCVIPDITYLLENRSQVKGIVITHGHEDHIGAIPYILQQINLPIFATRLTMGLIEHKLEEHGLLESVRRKVVTFGQTVSLGKFSVEFIRTNHSIVDAAALAIYSPAGIVVHTGDFKVDYTPVYGDSIDLARFAEIGSKGVLALMCDSTNAERHGFTPSEKTLRPIFDNIFRNHADSRLLFSTFASNVDRVRQIINSAHEYGRKVAIEGRSMVNVINTAMDLGYIQIPDGILIDVGDLKNHAPEKTVIITTGSQGESMAALSRIAENTHKKLSIMEGDVVIFSSNPIPGNEKAVTKVINQLLQKGADVIFQDTHVSGHACQEEIKLIYTLVRPKYAIPVHGEYKHLKAHEALALDVGIAKENIFLIQSGDVLEIDHEGAEVTGKVPAGDVFVDGLGIGDVGNTVLRDRQRLAEDGILIAIAGVDSENGQLLSGPEIITRGFVYIRESDEIIKEARNVAWEVLENSLDNRSDWAKIKNQIKDALGEYVWRKTRRRPMILPVLTELNI